MKLLEDLVLVTEHGVEIIPKGTILETGAETIDVDLDSIKSEPQYSTKQLADMVERWISKNKKYVDEGKITEEQWDYVTSHLLTLMKVLYRGDKETVVDHLEAIRNQPVENEKEAKLKGIIVKVYENIASKLGTFEIQGRKILGQESLAKLNVVLSEALRSFGQILAE